MAKLIRFKNQILDLEAIQYASYVPAQAETASRLRLVIGGVALGLDQDDDADALWKLIADRLTVEWINPDTSTTPTLPAI